MNNSARFKSIVAIIAILFVGWGLLSCISSAISSSSKESTSRDSYSYSAPKSTVDDGCLSAKDTWNNIGKNTCVIFSPAKFARSKGYYFIDEKANYTDGFVVFVGKKDIMSWNNFLIKYDVGKKIKVTGTIEMYQGHPEIKVYNLSQISVVE